MKRLTPYLITLVALTVFAADASAQIRVRGRNNQVNINTGGAAFAASSFYAAPAVRKNVVVREQVVVQQQVVKQQKFVAPAAIYSAPARLSSGYCGGASAFSGYYAPAPITYSLPLCQGYAQNFSAPAPQLTAPQSQLQAPAAPASITINNTSNSGTSPPKEEVK